MITPYDAYCQFLDIVRHPKDVFVSWVALCDAGAKMMAGWAPPNEEAVPAHLEFWKAYYKTECDFFLPEGRLAPRTRTTANNPIPHHPTPSNTIQPQATRRIARWFVSARS
jgi:hypothetical protein